MIDYNNKKIYITHEPVLIQRWFILFIQIKTLALHLMSNYVEIYII